MKILQALENYILSFFLEKEERIEQREVYFSLRDLEDREIARVKRSFEARKRLRIV